MIDRSIDTIGSLYMFTAFVALFEVIAVFLPGGFC